MKAYHCKLYITCLIKGIFGHDKHVFITINVPFIVPVRPTQRGDKSDPVF